MKYSTPATSYQLVEACFYFVLGNTHQNKHLNLTGDVILKNMSVFHLREAFSAACQTQENMCASFKSTVIEELNNCSKRQHQTIHLTSFHDS